MSLQVLLKVLLPSIPKNPVCFDSCVTYFHFKHSLWLVQQKDDAEFQSDFCAKKDIKFEV